MKSEDQKAKHAEYMRKYLASRSKNDPVWAEEYKRKKREYYARKKVDPEFMRRKRERHNLWNGSPKGMAYQQEYQEQNREVLNERGRRRYHERKHDPQFKACMLERTRRYLRTAKGRAKVNARNSAYRKTERGHLSYLNSRLRHDYGITLQQYTEILASQNGVCLICKQFRISTRAKRLVVDHNHKTNKIRGLLCWLCNKGLGLFEDDPARLQSAIEYLK